MRVDCLAQGHNAMTPARDQNQNVWSGVSTQRGRSTPFHGRYMGRLLYEAGAFGPRDRTCPCKSLLNWIPTESSALTTGPPCLPIIMFPQLLIITLEVYCDLRTHFQVYTMEPCLRVTSWQNAQTFSCKKTMLIQPPLNIKPMATFWNPNL